MEKENDPLTYEIISAAIAVSKYWGNGVLENVYKKSLAYELTSRGFDVVTEAAIPGNYGALQFDITFRADMIVNQTVIIEAKAITATLPVHQAQLLTYMRLSGSPTGLLMNFHAYPFTKHIIRLSLKS